MKLLKCLTLGLVLVSCAAAQQPSKQDNDKKDDVKKGKKTSEPVKKTGEPGVELTDALASLKKADAATKKVKLVRYEATFKTTGQFASMVPIIEGVAILAGSSEDALDKFRVEIKTKMPGSSETRELTLGSDGKIFFVIDPKEKVVYQGKDTQVLGSNVRLLQGFAMREFVHPHPFGDEIEGDKVELKGTIRIADETCYEIHVTYKDGVSEATWFISKKDFLPRQVDRYITGPSDEKGSLRTTITKLAIAPTFLVDPFKLIVPPGFKKSEKSAP